MALIGDFERNKLVSLKSDYERPRHAYILKFALQTPFECIGLRWFSEYLAISLVSLLTQHAYLALSSSAVWAFNFFHF